MGRSKRTVEEPLSIREQRFVEHYIRHGNATAAYVAAGYSQKSSRQNAHHLLTKQYIQEAIASAREEITSRLKVKREDFIAELISQAFFDPAELFEIEGEDVIMKDLRTAPQARKMISGITITKSHGKDGDSVSKSIRFRDSNKALNDVWEKLGFDRTISGRDRSAYLDRIRAAMERRKTGK